MKDTSGNYLFIVHNQVIEVHFIGMWDAEIAEQACEEFKEIARGIKDKPWACLLHLESWALATPKADLLIEEVQQWVLHNGQTHEATVIGDDASGEKTAKMNEYIDSYISDGEEKIHQRYFDSRAEAIDWLESIDFNFN